MTDRGFTLLEVIVALTILAMSLTVLFATFTDGVRRTEDTAARTQAGALAQSLLAAVGRESPMRNGDSTGIASSGFRWRIHVAPYDDDEARAAMTAHVVRVEVAWSDRGRDRSLSLDTLRLAVREPAR